MNGDEEKWVDSVIEELFRNSTVVGLGSEPCSVKDVDGNNCPEEPIMSFNVRRIKVHLCRNCYINYKNGAYKN